MEANTREIATNALYEILEQGSYSHIVMKGVLDKYSFLDKHMRAYINRVVLGTVEKKLTLDYIINIYSKTKVKKLKPWIRVAMELAVYEIIYMDSIPDHASVSEAVNTTRKHGYRQLTGFVNGVLRAVVSHRDEYGTDGISSLEDYSARYSMPEWIIELWTEQLGQESALKLCSAVLDKEDIGLCVAVNEAKTDITSLKNEIKGSLIDNDTLYLTEVDSLSSLPAFKEGRIFVQDYSSQQVASKVEYQDGIRILDVCAAPGGKSLNIASKLAVRGYNNSHVTSCDLTDKKVALIKENVDRLGLDNITVKKQDATLFNPEFENVYDVIVCDAPCSGLGIIRKKPDIKLRMTRADIDSLVQLQHTILNNVKRYLKPGGTLIYSTCTIDALENEQQMDRFIAENQEYTRINQQQFLTSEKQDGFYICTLKKN